ncbi:hypothetical protein HDU96_010835 [Phlyctochytrium bullatum]|nr:hypothetical protein HDU96_010835 [Phlyctochytrium bullatum]
MPATIEHLPVELVRRITLHIHPASFANLLDASPAIHRLFLVVDNELSFVRTHISFHRLSTTSDVPWWRLPEVYAVVSLLGMWEDMECCAFRYHDDKPCVGNVFWDLRCGTRELEFVHAPHRPHAWMESVMLKVLRAASLVKRRKCIMALKLASLLDSVPMLELVLSKLHSRQTKQKAPRSVKLTMGFDINSGSRCTVVWSLAYVATWAATDGAVNVLNYALQHPLHPVAYTLTFGSKKGCLIHKAARGAQVHVIHQLLGNPLPLTPPPKGRLIRPGNLSGPNPPFDPKSQPAFKSILYGDGNPLATLFDLDTFKSAPLHTLIRNFKGDALQAATYLLDQGAATVPLHEAVRHPELIGLLVSRGAAINARISQTNHFTALHEAVRCNEEESVWELLERGADVDGGGATGKTPLGLVMGSRKKNMKVVKMLLRAGACRLCIR